MGGRSRGRMQWRGIRYRYNDRGIGLPKGGAVIMSAVRTMALVPRADRLIPSAKAVLAMEFNRNQYFLAGLVVFLIGIQLRLVDGFVLNERATQVLAQRMQQMRGQHVASSNEATTLLASLPPGHQHTVHPPRWLGWSLVSVGSVLILYSLVLKRPGG